MDDQQLKKIMDECCKLGALAFHDGKTKRDNPFTHVLSRVPWLNGFDQAQAEVLSVEHVDPWVEEWLMEERESARRADGG